MDGQKQRSGGSGVVRSEVRPSSLQEAEVAWTRMKIVSVEKIRDVRCALDK